jgi:type III secretion protein Q
MAEGQPVRQLSVADLPAVGPAHAAALRLIHDPRLGEWLATSFDIALRNVGSVELTGSILAIDFACPGGTIKLGVQADVLPALAIAPGSGMQTLPSIMPLLASRLLAPLLKKLGSAASIQNNSRWDAVGVASVWRRDTSAWRTPRSTLAVWEVTVAHRLQTRIALLSMDPGCVDAIQELIGVGVIRQPRAASAWRVASRLRLSTRSWRIGLLQSLETGDVVLFNEDGAADVMEAKLLCGALVGRHWSGRVQINQRKVTLMSQMEPQEGSAEYDVDTSGPVLSPGVAELEVPVHFEVDNAALSLAQLSALRPGYVIELMIPVDQAEIRLVACGQVIGRGKLVVIGDCLGVQIEQLNHGNA